MARNDPHFNFRMPLEVREKLKSRASFNGRSMNAELLRIVEDALATTRAPAGYQDDAEILASKQAEKVKNMVFETLKVIYNKEK